jgi:Na+-transporting methylmalonyl-CoA/oxaloacetate decarboxylase beta subunit
MRACSSTLVGMIFLSVLCRAAEVVARVACAGSRVMLFLAAVILHGPDLSRQGLGISDHAK